MWATSENGNQGGRFCAVVRDCKKVSAYWPGRESGGHNGKVKKLFAWKVNRKIYRVLDTTTDFCAGIWNSFLRMMAFWIYRKILWFIYSIETIWLLRKWICLNLSSSKTHGSFVFISLVDDVFQWPAGLFWNFCCSSVLKLQVGQK